MDGSIESTNDREEITPLPEVIKYEEQMIKAAQEAEAALSRFRRLVLDKHWEVRARVNVELCNKCHEMQADVLHIATELFPNVSSPEIQFSNGCSLRFAHR